MPSSTKAGVRQPAPRADGQRLCGAAGCRLQWLAANEVDPLLGSEPVS
jgi:hypothetical protein